MYGLPSYVGSNRRLFRREVTGRDCREHSNYDAEMKPKLLGPLIFFSSLLWGGTQPSSPPVTDGLQVWLTAMDVGDALADGDPVSSWTDLSHGHVFRNSNDVLPTFVADSGDGKPAIDFSRSSGFIGDFSSTAGSTIGDATIFVVGRFAGYSHGAGSSSYWYSITSSTDGSEHTLGRDERAGTGPNALYHWRGRPDQKAYYGDDIQEHPGGAFNYYTSVFLGKESGGGVRASVNGVDGNLQNISGHPDTAYEADPSQTRIGLWTSNGSGLDGMIREVLIYDRVLSLEDIAQVESYLDEIASVVVEETPNQLSITRRDPNVILSWIGEGTLQFAGELDGDWVDRVDAPNPMEVEVSSREGYYRLAQREGIPEGGLVFRTQVKSDTHRIVEYHMDTGDLYFVGEIDHGFDWYSTNGNDLWWCFQNKVNRGSGLLEFLMRNNPQAQRMKTEAVVGGWATYTTRNYTFLLLTPLASQRTVANKNAPDIATDTGTTQPGTDDYREIDSSNLLFLLYHNTANGDINMGIGGLGVRTANVTGENPPGDKSPNLDNGVRADIAFKANIQLTDELKQILVDQFPSVTRSLDDGARAYAYDHPPGL